MEIKSYVNLDGNKIERLIPSEGAPERFFGVAQAVNNGTPFEVRFPVEGNSIEEAMKAFDAALAVFIQSVEAARLKAQEDSKNETSDKFSNSDVPKLVLNNG